MQTLLMTVSLGFAAPEAVFIRPSGVPVPSLAARRLLEDHGVTVQADPMPLEALAPPTTPQVLGAPTQPCEGAPVSPTTWKDAVADFPLLHATVPLETRRARLSDLAAERRCLSGVVSADLLARLDWEEGYMERNEGDPDRAQAAFRAWLALSSPGEHDLSSFSSGTMAQVVRAATALAGEASAEVRLAGSGAPVHLDGEPLEPDRPHEVRPGNHFLQVTAPEAVRTLEVHVGPGDRVLVWLPGAADVEGVALRRERTEAWLQATLAEGSTEVADLGGGGGVWTWRDGHLAERLPPPPTPVSTRPVALRWLGAGLLVAGGVTVVAGGWGAWSYGSAVESGTLIVAPRGDEDPQRSSDLLYARMLTPTLVGMTVTATGLATLVASRRTDSVMDE